MRARYSTDKFFSIFLSAKKCAAKIYSIRAYFPRLRFSCLELFFDPAALDYDEVVGIWSLEVTKIWARFLFVEADIPFYLIIAFCPIGFVVCP